MGPIFLFSTSIPAQYGEDYHLPSAKRELFEKTGPRVVIISSPSAASEDFFFPPSAFVASQNQTFHHLSLGENSKSLHG